MGSFDAHRRLPLTASILLLAVAAAARAAVPQPDSDLNAIDDQTRQLVARIEEEQAKNGPYSAELIDLFTALTSLYEAGGDHALETAAIERTLQLVRVTYGLHSLEQAPALWRLVADEERKGNVPAVWALEQELLDLARRNPDDVRTVRILHKIGDRRLDVLERYDEGREFPPQIILGCYYHAGPLLAVEEAKNCSAGNKSDVIRALLHEVQSDYEAAIRMLLQQKLYSSDELHELETALVRSSYEYGNYNAGADSLRRLLAYDIATAEPSLTQIEALLRIADWDLMFGLTGLEIYQGAYDQLEQAGVADASIREILAPDVPVVLPAFLPNPLASVDPRASTGFIDVAFDISKDGRSRRVGILDAMNATKAAKQRLLVLIKRSRFRPRLVDGQFPEWPRVTLRYYLND